MAEGKDAGSRVNSRLSGKSSDADTDLAEHVSLRAADLTAHRRLVLLKRHGDREAILLDAARSAPASDDPT